MARIRTVKPEFWTHNVLARLDDFHQLLAIALLNYSDDEGYFHAEPALIRGAVMPFRDDLASISRALAMLEKVEYLELREHPERGLIGRITNWSRHQKVDHASKSKIKELFDFATSSRNPREKLAPEQGTGNREQGTGKTPSAAVGSLATELTDFEAFWKAYPKKTGKGEARKSWVRLKPNGATLTAILAALSWQVVTEQWTRDGGRFIPNPATYLNQQRWLDEPPAAAAVPGLTPNGQKSASAASRWLEGNAEPMEQKA